MIIDGILDRKDGEPYDPKTFYNYCMGYGEISHGITRAMDSGSNRDVQEELADYIIENDYNRDIIEYIYSKDWITSDGGKRK